MSIVDKKPLRKEALECAKQFKRAWLDMAEVLNKVAGRKAYEVWGYDSVHDYAASELHIKPATVNKLIYSFSTVKRYAPEALKRDGVKKKLPSLDAVEYFDRAIKKARFEDDGEREEVFGALKEAVFDDAQPVSILRKTFNPVLYPTDKRQQALAHLKSMRASIRKLDGLLAEPLKLDQAVVGRVQRALHQLLSDVEAQIAENTPKKTKAAS